jgi:prepilin peptidase CpaA
VDIHQVWDLCAVILLFVTLTVAAYTDLLHRKVYNWLTYPAIAMGLAFGFGIGGIGSSPWGHSLLSHITGAALGFGLLFVVYWSRAVGGGEVKLAAAVGAIYGFPFVLPALFWSSLVGALMALWTLVWRGQLMKGLRGAARYAISIKADLDPEDPAAVKIPYGVAMAFGTLVAFFLPIVMGGPA